MKTILLFGATGLTGQAFLQLAINDEKISKIIILTRTLLAIKHPKISQHVINFHNLNDYQQYFAVDEVFCCLGTTIKKAKSKQAFAAIDLDLVVQIAQMAKIQSVVKFMVISSIGADEDSPSFYSATKGRMELAVKACKLPQTYIFRPSLLLGKRNEVRLLEQLGIMIFQCLKFLFIGPLKHYQPITVDAVAKVMLHVSEYPVAQNHVQPVVTIIENENIHKLAETSYK